MHYPNHNAESAEGYSSLQLPSMLATLAEHGVRFVAVGPFALFLHGDLKTLPPAHLCFQQGWENCECLARAVQELDGRQVPESPYPTALLGQLKQASEPIRIALTTRRRFEERPMEFELWPHLPGMGSYEDLVPEATALKVGSTPVRALSIEQLIRWLQLHGEGQEGARLLARLTSGILTSDIRPQFSQPKGLRKDSMAQKKPRKGPRKKPA